MKEQERKRLTALAAEVRRETASTIAAFGVGHVGGAMSIVETLVQLYYKTMNIDPTRPRWEDRDRFVLSKGHSGPSLYAVLAMKGYFDREELKTLNRPGTRLPSHCDMNKTPGIDMTAGSLGQGLSAAVGMALAARMDGKSYRVYCIIGDGESQEGQIWEATMLAAQQRLDNLTVFLDDNGMQLDGYTDNVNSIRPVDKRWGGFGWEVITIDGHDFDQLDFALRIAQSTKGKPTLIHLVTTKGKGLPISEGKLSSHNMPITPEDLDLCLKALEEGV